MTNSRRYAGVTAMIALLMLCALGASARRHLTGHRGSGVPHAVSLAALLVGLVAAGVVVVLLLRSRRWQAPGSPTSLLYTVLAALVVLSLVVIVLILTGHHGVLRPPAGPGPGHLTSAAPSAGGAHGSRGAGSVLPVLIALVALVAVGVVGALVVRRRPGNPPAPGPAPDPEAETAVDFEHVLGRAATAMLDVDDPRDAIIAAYEQMQRAAQDRGLARGVTDTPAEFLARAAGAGAVDPAAAARLTALFERARFSHLPVAETDRVAARDALAELRAGWARP